MNDRTLIAAGAVGTILAAICCATPLLAVVLGGIGLTAWLADADYIVLSVLLLGVALAALGFHRRKVAAACRGTAGKEPGSGR